MRQVEQHCKLMFEEEVEVLVVDIGQILWKRGGGMQYYVELIVNSSQLQSS